MLMNCVSVDISQLDEMSPCVSRLRTSSVTSAGLTLQGAICQHEMGGPSNPPPPLPFPSPFLPSHFPSFPLEVGPLSYS